MRLLATIIVLLSCFGGLAASAVADTATLPANLGLPWTDPNFQSPLEVLLNPIASAVANRTVTVRCEGGYDWGILAQQRGFDPSVELGYVEALFWSTGTVASVSDFTELSPQVCLPLQQFAQAATKPTKCSTAVTSTTTKLVRVVRRVVFRVWRWEKIDGRRKRVRVLRYKNVTKLVPKTVTTTTQTPAAPCYTADGMRLNPQDTSYWEQYDQYAMAILALAHESIHLGGFVGGMLSNGVQGGYSDDEARANCYGMQWMPYVAEQLGASPDDALDIARYTYRYIYPGYNTATTAAYWSPQCVPGGALDLHLGANIWS